MTESRSDDLIDMIIITLIIQYYAVYGWTLLSAGHHGGRIRLLFTVYVKDIEYILETH